MALSQCSSELSTSLFSCSQPPLCVTQPVQPCRLVLNSFLPGVTEVTVALLCFLKHMLHPGVKLTLLNTPWLTLSHYSSEHTGPLLTSLPHYYLTQMEGDTHTHNNITGKVG